MNAQETGNSPKIKWFSVKEAAEFLDVGEPTLYRWMRDGKITYRKIGETTRFLQEDLDAMVEVFHRVKDADKARELCVICHSPELVEGWIQSTGLNYFRPGKTKFWTLTDSYLETRARMCPRCGAIFWQADPAKLAALRPPAPAAPPPGDPAAQPKKQPNS
jgi:excisionase family DNA binding protein